MLLLLLLEVVVAMLPLQVLLVRDQRAALNAVGVVTMSITKRRKKRGIVAMVMMTHRVLLVHDQRVASNAVAPLWTPRGVLCAGVAAALTPSLCRALLVRVLRGVSTAAVVRLLRIWCCGSQWRWCAWAVPGRPQALLVRDLRVALCVAVAVAVVAVVLLLR